MTGGRRVPVFVHYVDRFVDIQGIFWISIVDNFGDIVKISVLEGPFPKPARRGASLCNEYSLPAVDMLLCCCGNSIHSLTGIPGKGKMPP